MTNADLERPTLCVGAVVLREKSILLIQRKFPPAALKWSIPGGKVELGETLLQAVTREVFEETGLEIRPLRELGWVERISAEFHFVIVDFLAELVDFEESPSSASDALRAEFVLLSALDTLDLTDGLLEFLSEKMPGIAPGS